MDHPQAVSFINFERKSKLISQWRLHKARITNVKASFINLIIIFANLAL